MIASFSSFNKKMQQKHKLIVSTALFATFGISVLYVFRRYNKNILQRLRRAFDYRNPLRNQQIEVVSTFDDCKKIVERLQKLVIKK